MAPPDPAPIRPAGADRGADRTDSLADALAERYRIERELGAGGMATVYLAEDLKHHRKVAIKVLHPELSALLGPERFLKEIELTASLQHPHILPLFDSGSADGLLFYVMPFVDGETLRARLERERQLPITDAVRIATEAADALQYAHERGVVHRDVKPENILLQNGHALVADFGIALAVAQAGGARMTQTGLSLGTPQYMSPEQAMGERGIDARTDLFALGAVTYEMLVGEPPFDGPNAQAIVVRVLTERPAPPSAVRDTVSSEVDAAVLRALAKLPADRFQSAGAFAAALGSTPTPVSMRASSPAPVVRGWRATLIPAVAGLALGALAALAAVWSALRRAGTVEPTQRWAIVLPDSAPVRFVGSERLDFGARAFDIAPDGRQIVYVAPHGKSTQLYVRHTDDYEVRQLPGTEGAMLPVISPDGRWVAFVTDGELRKASLVDGQVVPLSTVTQPTGIVWMPDGHLLVADRWGSRLVAVPDAGGATRTLFDRPGSALDSPSLLPDGRHLVFARSGHLYVIDLRTGDERVLTDTGPVASNAIPNDAPVGSMPRYLPTGQLAYLDQSGTLTVVPFDVSALRFTGPPVRLVPHVRRESERWGEYAVSEAGTLVYVEGLDEQSARLALVGGSAAPDTLPLPAANYAGFQYAPDGRRLAVRIVAPTGAQDLWVYDLVRNSRRRLASETRNMTQPVWTRDGRAIVYGTHPGPLLRVNAVDGGVPDTLLAENVKPSDFSPDGRVLAGYALEGTPGVWHAVLWPAAGGVPRRVSDDSEPEWLPVFSPNGRWLAYEALVRGLLQVFVVPYPALRPRILVSDEAGGEEPLWSPRGDALYYRRGSRFMVVPVLGNDPHPFGAPRVFARGRFGEFVGRTHAVAPDGRLLVKLQNETDSTLTLRVVTHWLDAVAAATDSAVHATGR